MGLVPIRVEDHHVGRPSRRKSPIVPKEIRFQSFEHFPRFDEKVDVTNAPRWRAKRGTPSLSSIQG